MAFESGGGMARVAVLAILGSVLYALFIGSRGVVGEPLITIDREPASSSATAGDVRSATIDADACVWRPAKEYGSCRSFLGMYFDGRQCRTITGCGLLSDTPPFIDRGTCEETCQAKDLSVRGGLLYTELSTGQL